MAESDIKVSQLSTYTPDANTLLYGAFKQPDDSLASGKTTIGPMGTFINKTQVFNDLNTTAKTIVGAINELETGGGGGSSTLAGLSDVTITTPTDGQALIYDSASQEWVNGAGGGGSSTLAGLSDVDITTPSDGQVLTYDSVNQEWVNANAGGGSSTLSGLSDVDLTTPAEGEALVYDSVNQEWVNGEVGNAKYVELTQAEYDALEQGGNLEPDTMYFITDGQSPVSTDIIDDTTTAADKVWSSDKTDDEIQAVATVVSGKQDDLSCGQLANVDLNDYKTNGFYWVSQTNVSNKPATNFGYLIVANPSTVIQIFICFGNDTVTTRGDTYVRFYANNQWYSWAQIASSRPEPVKASRSGLTIAASTTSYFTFSGVPVKTGYTRMVTCANPSEGGLYYLRTVENGNDLRIYVNNSTGASVTFDLTIMVEYIAT